MRDLQIRLGRFVVASVASRSAQARIMNTDRVIECETGTDLVVAEQPYPRRLIVLVISDHDIVRANLQQIALCNLNIAKARAHASSARQTEPISNNPPRLKLSRHRRRRGRDLRRRSRRIVLLLQILLLLVVRVVVGLCQIGCSEGFRWMRLE